MNPDVGVNLRARIARCLAALLLGLSATARGDEGLWTFDDLPLALLKERYGFTPGEDWVRRLRAATLQFGLGGSGVLVSPDGLVMTNYHIARAAVHDLSTLEQDFVEDGFLALRRGEEPLCGGLELLQLVSIDDVTAVIHQAARQLEGEEAEQARRQAKSAIEKRESARTGLRCRVERFHSGAQFCVYRYKVYDDVRLVFSPQRAVAEFGGARDNFCFPRWCLDVAFFRIYVDGEPAETPQHLRWSKRGVGRGDLVFAAGYPATSGRMETAAVCEFNRDFFYPHALSYIRDVLDGLRRFAARGAEPARRSREARARWDNTLKRFTGLLEGLAVEGVMAKIRRRDQELLERAGDRRAEVEKVQHELGEILDNYRTFGHRRLFSRFDSRLPRLVWDIMTLVEQLERPNEKRDPEYRDEALDATKISLLSPETFDLEMEAARITSSIASARRHLGKDDPFVRACLDEAGLDGLEAAILRTRVADVEYRKKLVAGGRKALEGSEDAMVRIALASRPLCDQLAERARAEFFGPYRVLAGRLAQLRRTILGRDGPPEANGTPRLSFGVVRGYEQGTTDVPHMTSIWGLFERHNCMQGEAPYDLPETWLKARRRFDLDTPFNFACTVDSLGGSSGSAIVDREGRLVGILFDGNIQSLANHFIYDDRTARAVCVDVRIVIEALRKVYDADSLADEIVGRRTFK